MMARISNPDSPDWELGQYERKTYHSIMKVVQGL